MSGSNVAGSVAIYGTQFVEHRNNTPGALSGCSMVYHRNTQSLYMYGGHGLALSTSLGILMEN